MDPDKFLSWRASWVRSSSRRMTVARVATRTVFSFGIVIRISSMASCSMTSGSSPMEIKNPIHARNKRPSLANIVRSSLFLRGSISRRNRVLRHEMAYGFSDSFFLLTLLAPPVQKIILFPRQFLIVLVDLCAQLGEAFVDFFFQPLVLRLLCGLKILEVFLQNALESVQSAIALHRVFDDLVYLHPCSIEIGRAHV